ncbi:hypothetical protein F2P79_022620 [Pimephales promelas]|nr:hypothetical protein F2P79_022620 [Pimephales promelas]
MALVNGLLHQLLDGQELLKFDGRGVKDDVRDDRTSCSADERNRMICLKLLFGAWLRMNIHHWWAGHSEKPLTAKVHAERNADLLKRSPRNPASAQRSRRSSSPLCSALAQEGP